MCWCACTRSNRLGMWLTTPDVRRPALLGLQGHSCTPSTIYQERSLLERAMHMACQGCMLVCCCNAPSCTAVVNNVLPQHAQSPMHCNTPASGL